MGRHGVDVTSDIEPLEDKREKIIRFEKALYNCEQVDIAIKHYFANGLYAREMFVPKGVMFTGKVHKTQHIIVVSQGDMTIADENGSRRVKAPFTMVCEPGTKRAGYAHEDTVWTNFHVNPDNEQDIDKVEQALVCDTFEEAQIAMQETLRLEDVKWHS